MVHLKAIKNQLPNEIKALFSELKVTQFLKQAHMEKQKGYSEAILLTFLFSLVFKVLKPSSQWAGKRPIHEKRYRVSMDEQSP